MIRILICLLLLILVAAKVAAQSYEREFKTFAKQDQLQPPPKEVLLFTGSSSIRLWNGLSDDFPDKAVLNRGFGGSTLLDLEQHLDKVVFPYQPRQIIIYSGDNDIAKGANAQEVLLRFERVFTKIRQQMPGVSIAFISIKPSLARKAKMEEMRKANGLIKDFLDKQEATAYIDIFSPMLNKAGMPRPELFAPDGLHLNEAGYAVWTKAVAPVLE